MQEVGKGKGKISFGGGSNSLDRITKWDGAGKYLNTKGRKEEKKSKEKHKGESIQVKLT